MAVVNFAKKKSQVYGVKKGERSLSISTLDQ